MRKELTKDLKWRNIKHENYRTYVFVRDGMTFNVTINRPVMLNVSKSGGHRILDSENRSHYIPSGWIHLYWNTDDDNAFLF